MIVGLERFFKTAIVDRNPSIASASLVSSYHLHPIARDIIKRWSNECTEALSAKPVPYSSASATSHQSSSAIVQYHALGLLYLIRSGDRMAVTKLIQGMSAGGAGARNSLGGGGGGLRSPYAICMLIRFAAKVMEEDPK